MADRSPAWSLRGRLLRISAIALAASLLFGGFAMYWAASIEESQMLDARLEHLGATVLSFVEDELGEMSQGGPTRLLHLKTRASAALLYRYQVWSRHGSLLMRSHEAPESVPLMAMGNLGYATVHFDNEEYRAFALPSRNGEFIVQVAENVEERWTQIGLTTVYYVGFLLLPFGLVYVTTWTMLRRSLGSIDTIAVQLGNRNPLDLTPVQVDDPPEELLPILNAVDTLFARVGNALSAERKFTSVAAHEMRTPLAGLRAQAQIAGHSDSPEDLHDALKAILTGVDRASHMLDQLLDLARIESLPQGAELPRHWVNLSGVYQDVMGDLGPKAAQKEITFGARFPAEAVYGHTFAIYLLLRNLVANAILYTPVGGRVEVTSFRDDQTVIVSVDDSGPGIRKAERERAFERFNRLGQSRSQGVGLGLSIALTVVELHHAKIRLLDSALGGLRAQVVFAFGVTRHPAGKAA